METKVSCIFKHTHLNFLYDIVYQQKHKNCDSNAFLSVWSPYTYNVFGRRGIEPKTELKPFLKTAVNVFCMHKTDFFSWIRFFLYLIYYIIIGIKPAPVDHKFNFKKIYSIPFGINTTGTNVFIDCSCKILKADMTRCPIYISFVSSSRGVTKCLKSTKFHW